MDVRTETIIERPLERVAGYAADPAHAPEWYVNISSIAWHGPPGVRLGARMDFVARFLGRRLAYTYEIVEFSPLERLVMRTADGPFPMETTYTWQTHGEGGTLMTLQNAGEPAGFSGLAAPIMERAMRRANRKDLARLNQILEAG